MYIACCDLLPRPRYWLWGIWTVCFIAEIRVALIHCVCVCLLSTFFFAYGAPLPPTRMFACLFYVSGVCIKLRLCKLLEREGEGEGERERGRIRLRQTGR